MLTLADYKGWDDVYDTYMDPCQEYCKETSKGKLYVVRDRCSPAWYIALNNKEIFFSLDSQRKVSEKEIIKFLWKLYYNKEENE